jgi:hypothetical protein
MTFDGKIMLNGAFDYSVQQSRCKGLMRFSGPQKNFPHDVEIPPAGASLY